ncbi:MAG: M56 family metallopeptidase, partial [Thermoanaerobaculia bacterium]
TPLTGFWALGLDSPVAELAAPAAEIPRSEFRSLAPTPVVAQPADATPAVAPGTPLPTSQPPQPVAWTVAISGSWLGVGIVLCLLLGFSYLRLAYRLRGRTEISSGRLPRVLARLLGEISRPIRMTTTHRLRIPIAKGVIRREICLPRRALNDLTPEQQETLLAHETAHLLHRDPFWLAIARFVESLFFFQPLNRLARRRMQEISEFRCDDWTVERTGRPLTLARCLTEVAGWNVGAAAPLPAPGMAQDTSGLGSRVRRLLDRDYPQPREEQPRWLRPVLAAVLLVVVVSAPGISLAGGEEEPPPEPPPAPERPVAEADEPPAPPSAPATVAPVVAATPTPVAILAPVPVVAPAPAAMATPAPAPRLALAAAPAAAALPASSAPKIATNTEESEEIEYAEDSAEEKIDEFLDEMDEALDEVEDEIDEELESVEEAVEEDLEALEEQLEGQIEVYEEEFEAQIEALEDEMDSWEDSVDERFDDRGSERREEAFDHDLEAFEDAADRRLERLEDELDRIDERFENQIEATIEGAIENSLEIELDTIERQFETHERELERLAHEAEHRARTEGLSAEDMDRFRAEARRIAEEARPSAEQMAAMKDQLRRAGEEAKRAVAQAEIDSAELEAALEAWRADYQVELEKLRADLRSLQSKYD